ncbi:synaptotagmin-like protein 5 isoform X8 [Anneissia japonica]|uniref:synaptotagmin-like protein 5 isoform X8 n=1 Tax=Anneissia japonica TaxID=1529436 RepID=UPI001425ABE4|nr:synaptotagmin-like protein 5 isoform X8 [Anneissia japonica]
MSETALQYSSSSLSVHLSWNQASREIMPGENNDVKVDSRRPPQLKMIELDHLTEQEQQVIIDVLQRDEILRKNEESRIRKLRLELQDLRKQGTIREGDDKKNLCARCREPLGMFASTEVCPKCQHTVCKECQVFTPSRKRWVCKVCHKSMQIKIESGEWFYEKLEVDNVRLFGSDLVKASLDRVHNRSKANSFDEQDESSRQNYQGKQNHYAGTPRSTPHGTPRSTPRATPRGTPRGMSPHGSPQRRRGNRSQDSVSVTSSEGNRTRGQQNEVDRSESASSIQSRGMAETDASKPPNGYEVEGDKSKQRRSSLEKVKTEVDVAVEVTEAPDQTQALTPSGINPYDESPYSDSEASIEIEDVFLSETASSSKSSTKRSCREHLKGKLTLDLSGVYRADQPRFGVGQKDLRGKNPENSKAAGSSLNKLTQKRKALQQKVANLKSRLSLRKERPEAECDSAIDNDDLNLNDISSDEEEDLLDLKLDPDIRCASPTYKEAMFDAKLKANQALVTNLIEQYSNPSLSRPSSICFTNSDDSEDSRAEDVREFEENEMKCNSPDYYGESSSDEDIPDMKDNRRHRKSRSKGQVTRMVDSGHLTASPESLLLEMKSNRFKEVNSKEHKESSSSDSDIEDEYKLQQPLILHYTLRAATSESELSVILEQTEESDVEDNYLS